MEQATDSGYEGYDVVQSRGKFVVYAPREACLSGSLFVFKAGGKIMAEANCNDLMSLAREYSTKYVLLDMKDVPYVDHAGLSSIVSSYTILSRQGGSLRLCNLRKNVKDLLSITKLLTVFKTYDTLDDAVNVVRKTIDPMKRLELMAEEARRQ